MIIVIITIFFINHNNHAQTEERVDVWDFPNTLEIDKEWNLLSFPEVTVLSETDWEVMSIRSTQWDIVDERQIIMQIWDWNTEEETIDKIDRQVWQKYTEFYEKMDKYNQFEMEYWEEITTLENELFENDAALRIAIDIWDTETESIERKEIQDINKKLTSLKAERDMLKSDITSIENEIQSSNKESINLYYEFDKWTPRAPFMWIIWDIYVQEWDEVKNWDKLFTIINNNYTPEISVWLDFNEYILTQDLTWVQIITENENRWNSYYECEIYTRSPILNDEWKYTITIKFIEDDIPNLILSDENTKITVIFTKDFPTIWIPENCFTEISKDKWILTLRDWEVTTWKEVWIKNKRDKWINVDDLGLFWLEEENKKSWIDLCIEDWNNELYKDESVVEWRSQFETVEEFCTEFIKVNPMYWSGHRNAAIVSLLWWPGEKIEVLCRLNSD